MTSSAGTIGDYYRLLGISSDATPREIRAAYRGRVRLYHPDLVAGKSEDALEAATKMTAQLNKAYECLRDVDRRAAYDNSSRADTVSARRTSTALLVVSPRTLRCDVTPGDTVRLNLNVQSATPPSGDGPRVRPEHRLVAAAFIVTSLDKNGARLQVRVDTSKLAAHRIYHVPLLVSWGKLTGTATLAVRTTELRRAGFTPPPRRESTSFLRRHWTRHSDHRVRDLAGISLGGIVAPLLILAWASGVLAVSTPATPPLVAAICAVVLATTTWFLASSRLLRRPDLLSRIGVVWGHLMRWSGWILVGSCAVVFGIPAVAGILTVITVIATPFLGLVVIAVISALFDSQDK